MPTVREVFFEVLRAHGITTIFGNPGSNELPMLKDLPEDFRYVLALQEGVAIGLADGFAQASGRPALVNLHAASGTGNAMGNLTNSASGHVPVVITSGQQARRHIPLDALLTNVDASILTRPLVKWSAEPPRPADVPLALSKAILLADSAPNGPVYLSVPLDDWDLETDGNAAGLLTRRRVEGHPVVPDQPLQALADLLSRATNPVLILGPGVDTDDGWSGGVRLAEHAGLPVWIAPSPSRCPFPTRHLAFRGILPAGIGTLAATLAEHDLVLAFGTAIFRYHEFVEGDYLAPDTALVAVTSDPDEAARAPMGHVLIGDPSDALARLADLIPAGPTNDIVGGTARRAARRLDRCPPATPGGPPFSAEAILDVVDAAKAKDTVIVSEWTSTTGLWDRLSFTRPSSFYFPASGALGWGLPAAIGIQLAEPSRPVIALLGDGALHYTISGLWTAAQLQVPVVFVVARNSEYAALKEFTHLMDAPDTPGLDLPDMDIVSLSNAYGIPSSRVDSLAGFETEVRSAQAAAGPRLIEVPQRSVTFA